MSLAEDDLPFDVAVRSTADATVLAFHGDLDLVSADEANQAIIGAQSEGATVVLDLRGLRFLDSSGLRIVLEAKRRADTAGGRLIIAPGEGGVRRVFDISGVGALIEVVDAPPEDG